MVDILISTKVLFKEYQGMFQFLLILFQEQLIEAEGDPLAQTQGQAAAASTSVATPTPKRKPCKVETVKSWGIEWLEYEEKDGFVSALCIW